MIFHAAVHFTLMIIIYSQMEYKENELTEAWEKFKVIKTKKYQKILEEINNEENI